MPPKQSWQVLRREKPSKEGMYYSVRAYDHCDQIKGVMQKKYQILDDNFI